MMAKQKTALITGITGQDGAYLGEFLLKRGYQVHGIKRRASLFNTERIDHLYQDVQVDDPDFFLHYGDLADATIAKVQQVLESVTRREKMVNTNYEIATRHYSYAVLQKQLNSMLMNFFGTQVPQHLKKVVRYLTQRIKEDG